MKKIILSLALVIATTTAFSQVEFNPGVRLGVNQSKITNSELEAKTGLYAGLFANIQFTDFYALQPEITYSNQGGKSDINGVDDLNIHYVSVGVANKFFVVKDLGLHIIVGPSIDLNFEDNWINLINDDGDIDITPIDFTIFGGVGYEFPFGLSIEARYKHGLLDLDTDDNSYYDTNGNYQYYNYDDNQLNAVFQIGVSYKFNFK